MDNLEIYKLTPDRLDDYLYFFENVAHTDNKQWDRCYCLDYCSASNAHLSKEFDDADVRRKYAIEYVNKGIIQGYLAYYNNQPVGWLNANDRDKCTNCMGMQEDIFNFKKIKMSDKKIKSIFCFTVAPEMRGKHIAQALLERAIEDAKADGYEYMEAYPNKKDADIYYNYVGPMGLYNKFGFEKYGKTKYRFILRKKL
ncbi:MAG: GNAT family N-acetyltransferase [Eubacterium sp.]|nr:GNAT family N-acetyltransferase [Eubacterium sp.]